MDIDLVLRAYSQTTVSFEELEFLHGTNEGLLSSGMGNIEISDKGHEQNENLSLQQTEFMMSCLTKRQQKVVKLLSEGKTPKEIAIEMGVITQAVYQIILRIRRRMILRANVSMCNF